MAIGGGAALLLGGAGPYVATMSDADAYAASVKPGADGKTIQTSYAEAESKAGSINLRRGVSAAMAGVGLASAAFGTWLVLRGDAAVAITPTRGGAQLALAGRF